jgi:hypothetical protein
MVGWDNDKSLYRQGTVLLRNVKEVLDKAASQNKVYSLFFIKK